MAAALANNRGMFANAASVDTDRVEILERALDRLSANDPARALVLADLCSELTGFSELERRQALADEAVAIARSTGDDATIVRVLNHIVWPLSLPQLLEQQLAWSAEALQRAERLGDPVLLFWAAHTRAFALLRAGDVDEMNRCWEIAWSLAERLDQPTLNWHSGMMRAMCAQLAGDNDTAEAWATEALRIGTDSGQPDATTLYAAQLGTLMTQRGAAGEMSPLLEQLADDLPENKGVVTAAIAGNYVETGRVAEAHHLLRTFAATGFAHPPNPGDVALHDDDVRARRRRQPRRRDRRGVVQPTRPVRRPGPHDRHFGVRSDQPRPR